MVTNHHRHSVFVTQHFCTTTSMLLIIRAMREMVPARQFLQQPHHVICLMVYQGFAAGSFGRENMKTKQEIEDRLKVFKRLEPTVIDGSKREMVILSAIDELHWVLGGE